MNQTFKNGTHFVRISFFLWEFVQLNHQLNYGEEFHCLPRQKDANNVINVKKG